MPNSARSSRPWLDDAGVARAFQMASHLPSQEHVRLRVGVLSAEGVMIAGGVVRGFEQAGFLRDQLRIIGFDEHLPSRGEPNYGCDLVLKQQPRLRDGVGADLLRRGRPLWPPRAREGRRA
ncbi:MAG TPA: hypothetical protein VEB23_06185 [Ramlibacter sp.]|nr:hypothetical protein [Ramlibacter sp.]